MQFHQFQFIYTLRYINNYQDANFNFAFIADQRTDSKMIPLSERSTVSVFGRGKRAVQSASPLLAKLGYPHFDMRVPEQLQNQAGTSKKILRKRFEIWQTGK